MSDQLSLFSMDSDTPVANHPTLHVRIALKPPNDEAVLSPAMTVEPFPEETTQFMPEINVPTHFH
jgi:hypothetical protein